MAIHWVVISFVYNRVGLEAAFRKRRGVGVFGGRVDTFRTRKVSIVIYYRILRLKFILQLTKSIQEKLFSMYEVVNISTQNWNK